jgi:hypothetical protein
MAASARDFMPLPRVGVNALAGCQIAMQVTNSLFGKAVSQNITLSLGASYLGLHIIKLLQLSVQCLVQLSSGARALLNFCIGL